MHVLDHAHDLLRRLATHPVPARRVVRRDGRVVLVAPATGFADHTSTCCWPSRRPRTARGFRMTGLIAMGRQAGAGDGFAQCVRDRRYASWTRSVTDAAAHAGITSTPAVLVNGAVVPRTATLSAPAVAAAG